MNFCGPSIKLCNGLPGSFASVWNVSNYDCLFTVAENSPTASYLDPANVFKGIRIHYTHGMSFTDIELICDQAYKKPALVHAERVHVTRSPSIRPIVSAFPAMSSRTN